MARKERDLQYVYGDNYRYLFNDSTHDGFGASNRICRPENASYKSSLLSLRTTHSLSRPSYCRCLLGTCVPISPCTLTPYRLPDLSDSFRCEYMSVFSALDRASAIVHPFIGFYDWISDQQRHGLQASTHILRCSSLDLHFNNRCPPISQPFIVQHS
ncbi:hypothetical protein AcW1_007179 [Taiwanofungus camphoratus]|nr:hypothetical protein AcW2_007753 [Antrodia cinnamomea]KAI0952788.1 hypothetical protein AcW1_007179 [Antrodia cinnamomea]